MRGHICAGHSLDRVMTHMNLLYAIGCYGNVYPRRRCVVKPWSALRVQIKWPDHYALMRHNYDPIYPQKIGIKHFLIKTLEGMRLTCFTF